MTPPTDIEKWLAGKGSGFLKRVGVQPGQTVLDFGCSQGNYTKPAAEVAGPTGKVYAVDKDGEGLNQFQRTITETQIRNVEFLRVSENDEIPLPACSVDIALLYDVLHGGYFPQTDQRMRVLQSIRRVLKPLGLLSLYPTHLKKFGLTFDELLGEVKAAGFSLRGEAYRKLVHDGHFTRGRVFSFAKTS